MVPPCPSLRARRFGLVLARTARTASRAFDEALTAAGGSLPAWLIFLSLQTRRLGSQRELAGAVGIRGATLTHHLNAMEADGLVTRRRDPVNRRIHHVELTEAGEALFRQLAGAAIAFDPAAAGGPGRQRHRCPGAGPGPAARERDRPAASGRIGRGAFSAGPDWHGAGPALAVQPPQDRRSLGRRSRSE